MKLVAALSALTAVAASACAPAHIDPYTPKRRTYVYEGQKSADAAPDASGSLWRPDAPASALYSDAPVLREQDIVVIRVEELADARRTAGTDIARETETAGSVNAFLQAAGTSVLDPTEGGFGATGKSRTDARTESGRTERLVATVPALVQKVLPNGNLFVEGHRVVLVNQEEHHFYISGVVRPIDIAQDNSVKSSQLAEAEVEFTGRGVMADAQPPGVFARFFAFIWPF